MYHTLDCSFPGCRSCFHSLSDLVLHGMNHKKSDGKWWCCVCLRFLRAHTVKTTHCERKNTWIMLRSFFEKLGWSQKNFSTFAPLPLSSFRTMSIGNLQTLVPKNI